MKRKNLDRDQRVWEEINMSYHFLLDLALILLSTKILGLIAQKFQMPQVVGALIAGLLLSPAGLGLLSETEFTKQLSELGVIVLMFSAGMGTDINELKHSGKSGFMSRSSAWSCRFSWARRLPGARMSWDSLRAPALSKTSSSAPS